MEGSASGCPSHHHHRAGALVHHCAALAKRSAVLFNGRRAHFGRHDVLHHRRRDRHDPHGRAHRYRHDKNEKARCRYHAFVLLGFIITVSEPDLQVLASQVPSVPNLILILSVACGVGMFLVVSLLRMLFSIALPPLLVGCYAVVFLLVFFVPPEFLAVAFDSGRRDDRPHDRTVHHGARCRFSPSEAIAAHRRTALVWLRCAASDRYWRCCCLVFSIRQTVQATRQ